MPLSLSLDLLDRCVSVLQLRALAALAALAHGILDMSDDEMLVCSRRCWQLVADSWAALKRQRHGQNSASAKAKGSRYGRR